VYDVIIVGARCGGSPTAMLAARQGLRVLLIDKAAFPSDTIGTHFMQPRGGAYLRRWGLWNDVLASNAPSWPEHSVTREGIGPITGPNCPVKMSARFREVHGWELDFSGRDGGLALGYTAPRRTALDKILVDGAVAAGAELREETAVEGLLWDGGRVVGVRGTTRGGTAFEERARVVVGADGRHSRIAQQVGAQKSREEPRCTFCYWTYWEGLSLPRTIGRDSGLFLRGRLGISAFPTNDGLTHILVMGPKEWFPSFKSNIEANYQAIVDFCAPELGAAIRECRRAERIYGTIDQPQYFSVSHGPGWALVGDAGYSKDQCTAIGMTHAFRDSELLAEAIHDGLGGKAASLDAALAEYQARRDRDASDYYDFVCARARCNPPRLQDLKVFAALRGNRQLIAEYMGTAGDATHIREFYSPENLESVLAQAKPEFPEPEILRNFEAMSANYDVDPFKSPEVLRPLEGARPAMARQAASVVKGEVRREEA
jgi:flavin-dependent dehydrogenase